MEEQEAIIADGTETSQALSRLTARCAREAENDVGNGQRLIHRFGAQLLNIAELESALGPGWYRWDGRRWTGEGARTWAARAAQETASLIAEEAEYLEQADHERPVNDVTYSKTEVSNSPQNRRSGQYREAARATIRQGQANARKLRTRKRHRLNFGISSGNGTRLRNMLRAATPHLTKSQGQFDQDPCALNVLNGTLRFVADDPEHGARGRSWRARLDSHDPRDLISKLAPVNYEPEAQAPQFLSSLRRFQPNAPVRDWLQRYYGYGITGLHGEQCFIFNSGSGSNWKSTFTEIIFRVIGSYGEMLKIESLAGFGTVGGSQASPDFARLPGARLVRAGEPERGMPLKEGLIKSLTGGEPMLARHNFCDFFEFRPTFKLTLSGNHRLEIRGADHGIWRRMRHVVWPVTIPDDERKSFDEVVSQLWSERSGILNWLVEGALKYLEQGLQPPDEISEMTRAYRESVDSVTAFLDECVDRFPETPTAPSEGARLLYETFKSWCHRNAFRSCDEKAFAASLESKGLNTRRDNKGRRYVATRLRPVT